MLLKGVFGVARDVSEQVGSLLCRHYCIVEDTVLGKLSGSRLEPRDVFWDRLLQLVPFSCSLSIGCCCICILMTVCFCLLWHLLNCRLHLESRSLALNQKCKAPENGESVKHCLAVQSLYYISLMYKMPDRVSSQGGPEWMRL